MTITEQLAEALGAARDFIGSTALESPSCHTLKSQGNILTQANDALAAYEASKAEEEW
jgi:hypothetical protein